MKKLSRQQKAANTRKAKNKIIKGLKEAIALKMTKSLDGWKVSKNQVGPAVATYTPAPALTLCGQLEDAIMLLETRISNATAKINSLM